MFDKNYYAQKKQSLLQKRNRLVFQYSDAAVNYVNSIVEVNRDLAEIEAWEAQQAQLPQEPKEKVEGEMNIAAGTGKVKKEEKKEVQKKIKK